MRVLRYHTLVLAYGLVGPSTHALFLGEIEQRFRRIAGLCLSRLTELDGSHTTEHQKDGAAQPPAVQTLERHRGTADSRGFKVTTSLKLSSFFPGGT